MKKGYIHSRLGTFGLEVCYKERQLLAHALRHGGLGLRNPQTNLSGIYANTEYNNSILITAKLTDSIYNQNLNLECNPLDHVRRMQNAAIAGKKYLRNCPLSHNNL